MTPFKTVPFKFSDEAFTWIMDFVGPIVEDYQKNAPLSSALLHLSDEQIDLIKSSSVWSEVTKFSKQYNLTDPWPQLFVYKDLERPRPIHLGNPHIDTYGKDQIEHTASIRFNILLKGEDSTEMVWWNKDRSDPLVTVNQFIRPNGIMAGRIQAVGNDLKSQWDILGEPDYRATHLASVQEYASFVRTDILHALNWTGNQSRVVFSIRYKDAWSAIE